MVSYTIHCVGTSREVYCWYKNSQIWSVCVKSFSWRMHVDISFD